MAGSLLVWGAAEAGAGIDISVSAPSATERELVDYLVSVEECESVAFIRVDGLEKDITPAEAIADPNNSLACSFPFSLTGPLINSPSVEVHNIDDSVVSHAETFSPEVRQPTLAGC